MAAGRRLGLLAAAALAVAGGVALAGRGRRPTLVNWALTHRLALRMADARGEPASSAALTATYTDLVARSYAAVSDYIEAPIPATVDTVRVLRRAEWISANLANFRRILRPVIEAYEQGQSGGVGARVLGTATQYGVSTQLGVLLGFLGRRVLGQYDIPLLDPEPGPASIYFVDANLRAVAARAVVPIDDLRLWVTLHEVTHAFQFHAGNPAWLHGYTSGLLEDYLDEAVAMLGRQGELRAWLGAAVRDTQRGRLSQSGWLRLALSPRQVRTLEQIQALMTVLEGYSNHVMHATGARLIPGYPVLARRMRARERTQASWARLLTRLLGLEMKLEQYRIGEAFVDEVVRRGGMTFASRLWQGPAQLPTLAETRDPAAWMVRVAATDAVPALSRPQVAEKEGSGGGSIPSPLVGEG